jgi:hypothetical protein
MSLSLVLENTPGFDIILGFRGFPTSSAVQLKAKVFFSRGNGKLPFTSLCSCEKQNTAIYTFSGSSKETRGPAKRTRITKTSFGGGF